MQGEGMSIFFYFFLFLILRLIVASSWVFYLSRYNRAWLYFALDLLEKGFDQIQGGKSENMHVLGRLTISFLKQNILNV